MIFFGDTTLEEHVKQPFYKTINAGAQDFFLHFTQYSWNKGLNRTLQKTFQLNQYSGAKRLKRDESFQRHRVVFGLDMGTCHALRRTAAQFSTGFRLPYDG